MRNVEEACIRFPVNYMIELIREAKLNKKTGQLELELEDPADLADFLLSWSIFQAYASKVIHDNIELAFPYISWEGESPRATKKR